MNDTLQVHSVTPTTRYDRMWVKPDGSLINVMVDLMKFTTLRGHKITAWLFSREGLDALKTNTAFSSIGVPDDASPNLGEIFGIPVRVVPEMEGSIFTYSTDYTDRLEATIKGLMERKSHE